LWRTPERRRRLRPSEIETGETSSSGLKWQMESKEEVLINLRERSPPENVSCIMAIALLRPHKSGYEHLGTKEVNMRNLLGLLIRDWTLLVVLLVVLVLANADPCPGSSTCPTGQTAIVQGPNAVEVKRIEPDSLPIEYLVTSTPSAPNQPVQFQVVNPNDWQDRIIYGLQPNTSYSFTICGWYSSSNQSCVKTNSVKTLGPAARGSFPTPTITQSYATTTPISISWNGGRNYDFYQVYQIESAYASIGQPQDSPRSRTSLRSPPCRGRDRELRPLVLR
jgi:hypothetical protein